MNILYIALISAFVILFGLIVLLLYTMFKGKKELIDTPIDINFLSHLDNKHFIGNEISSIGAKDNYHFIKMMPKDVDIEKLKKNEQIKEEDIIVENNKLCVFPKGTVSPDKHINILLPKHANDFHEAVKNSVIGKGLMLAVEMQNSANVEIASMLEGHNRKDDILKRIGHAEISKEQLNFIEEIYRDSLRMALDARSRDKNVSVTGASLIPKHE